MKKSLLLLTLFLPSGFAQQWSMGFWTGVTGEPIANLNWGGLTHIAHVGAAPKADGTLTLTCSIGPCATSLFASQVTTLITTAHSNNVKVLLNLGNVAGSLWSGAAGTNRTAFVNNIMNLVNTYNYDGVDLDWEQSFNGTQMTGLLSALRQKLGTKLLAADISATDGAYWGTVQQYLDRISVMTYDMVGTWNPYSWFNAAGYSDPCDCVWSVDLAKRRVTGGGVPASKLNIGIPFYGWTSTGASNTAPRQPYNGTPTMNQINYNQIKANYNISTPSWDSVAQVPWIPISNGWLTYDNEQSVAAKVNYAKSNNLGGWIIWELEQDYMGAGANPMHPLLTSIKNAMGPAAPATAPLITTVSPLPAGTVGAVYSQTIVASGTSPTFSISGGGLPAGLTLNPSGLISGTPTAAGPSTVTIQASNSAGNNAKQFSLTINSAAPVNTPPSITSASPLAAGTVGIAYSQAIVSSGSTPITWTITSGSLPAGLSLVTSPDTSSAVISGTPTASGPFTFTIRATNSAGNNAKQFSLTVNPAAPPVAVPPSVQIVAPTAGTLQSTTVPISVTVSSSVVSVQYRVDGVPLATVSQSPFSYNWNTSSLSKGWHNLDAIATDATGKSATSTVVRVRP